MLKQLVFTLILFASYNLNAQEGTTLEEYRYLSKGYVYQLEMGLDAQKEGYLVKKIFKTSKGIELIGLYQSGNSEPRALLVVMDQGKEKANYICIPSPKANQRVLDLAHSDQSNMSADLKNEYHAAVNEFLFAALSNPEIKTLAYTAPNHSPIHYQKDETLVSRSANLEQYIRESPNLEISESKTQTKNVKVATSSYHGDIANRPIVQFADAVSNGNKRGVVSIKICVDMGGNVISTKFTQRGSTTFNAYLKKVAIEAAKNIKFAKKDQAEQCGIVSYKF